jgi:hypothetical protein
MFLAGHADDESQRLHLFCVFHYTFAVTASWPDPDDAVLHELLCEASCLDRWS